MKKISLKISSDLVQQKDTCVLCKKTNTEFIALKVKLKGKILGLFTVNMEKTIMVCQSCISRFFGMFNSKK